MAKLGAGAIAGIAIACALVLGLGGFYKYNTMPTVENDRNVLLPTPGSIRIDPQLNSVSGGSRKHKKQGKPKKARKHSKRR
jgi:hypothetical protein